MSYHNYLKIAEKIAREAHEGQTDMLNRPYILHVERVVESVDAYDEKAVAWLHDVLEDTEVSADDLLALKIPAIIVLAVDILTRKPPFEYMHYIWSIKNAHGWAGYLAQAVKLADLNDNLGRIHELEENAHLLTRRTTSDNLRERYTKAKAILESGEL